jgi:hypothetical protein
LDRRRARGAVDLPLRRLSTLRASAGAFLPGLRGTQCRAAAGQRPRACGQLHGLPERYVLALVAITEQDDVRLVCNIVGCPPEAVTMDMPVRVVFEPHEDLWVPFFEPDPA